MPKRSVRPTGSKGAVQLPNLTASQKAELYIKEAIYHGALKPRERIVELELARKIGCSRAPVREAVLRLAREGVIVTIPRRGVFVRDFNADTIEEIFQMRAKLEGLCVRYLRQRMTPQDAQTLRDCIDDLAGAASDNDHERFLEVDMKLHRAIWRLSRCKEIYRTLNSIMIPFILMVARSTSAKLSLQQALEHHRDYVELVLTAPTKDVERKVEEYFMGIYDQLFRAAKNPADWQTGSATWLLDAAE